MKTSKKIISVILAVIMVIGTASTAFAGAIDTTKSVDKLIEQENIANVAEYLLKSINNRKDDITGTVLRLAFLFLKNEDLNTFIAGRDVTELSDEQNAEILVKWLNKVLQDNTTAITEAKWYGLAKAACAFLGIKLDLSNIDGAIRTLHDACEKCANPGLIGVAIDFADLGKLNGKALKDVSVKNKGNLGVVKALINWLSDNTYVIKRLIMSQLNAGSLNDTIKIDDINAKVKEFIGKDVILDKMYRLVYGGAKDGDFATSMYKDYTADQLLAAGFIKMMKCIDATNPANKIEKSECDEALSMSVYRLIAKYGPVFLENYKFKKDGKTIIEKLNSVFKGLIDALMNEDAVDAETKARFDFKEFTNADFNAIFENLGMIYDGIHTVSVPVSVKDPENPVKFEKFTKEIEFSKVSFGYKKSVEIIHDLSLKIKAGENVGIVGPSGAGKSTLISLLLRFYDVDSGAITIDGVNIKNFTQDDLRSLFSMVSQDSSLMHRTVGENIEYGAKSELQKEDLEEVAIATDSLNFIENLSDYRGGSGFDSVVGDRGVKLSGGQKQRISIARALAKRDANIFIFDDSFSALDYKTDKKLRDELSKMIEKKKSTVLIVAQRISTIKNADKIIVLDEGKIVGMGKHSELMKDCDVYKEIAYSQLSKEELEDAWA